MKQSQNGRRGRSRSNPRKSGKGQDANRVEIKVRGNPKQLLEKYKNAARDAMQAGDRVLAEHNLQFADHYQRCLNEMRGLTKGLFSGDYVVVERADRSPEPDEEGTDGESADTDGETVAADSEPQMRERRPRRPRRPRDQHDQSEDTAAADEPVDMLSSALPASIPVDGAVSEQPQEVHPELDLAAAAEAEEEAPKPRRRGRPRRAPVDAEAPASTPAEGDAA